METLQERLVRKYKEKEARHASRKRNLRIYQRLYNVLKDAIINNDIPEGVDLPATRKLAEALELSRTTVIKAYELLRLEGYIFSKTGAGHEVKSLQEPALDKPPASLSVERYPAISELGKSFAKNVSLINSTEDKSIAFRPGLPPLDIFPVNQWKNLSNLYWRHIKSSALSYSPSSGIEQLKRNIAAYLNLTRGVKCDHQQIIIVSGSLQSLYLTGSVLLNPGEGVVMENPTFPNVHSIFKGLQAKVKGLPVDGEGMRTDMLPKPKDGYKLLHVTPYCHYPDGHQMSMARKNELLNWANASEAFIIENDYEHELHGYQKEAPSLYSMDQEQRVIYLGTFNRLLHPSIRIGYMVLPPYLLAPVEALLKHSHRFVPSSIQVVLNQFMENKYLHSHIQRVVEVAKERLSLFEQICYEEFGEQLTLIKSEALSLHVVLRLPDQLSDTEVAAYFAENNIVTHAYSKCRISGAGMQGLILGYSSVRPPVIRRKLRQMARLYKARY